jgi:hypothetical protein
MFGFYTPVIILQALCVYHAYRNNAEQRWYWFILLFPVIGCIIYIVHHFSGRSSIETIATSVKEIVKSNYRIEQLERELKHSDNVTNKLNLADAYTSVARYDEAIDLYERALLGFMADDPDVRMKLLNVCFLKGDYDKVISLGKLLENERSFLNADERVSYALSLHQKGMTEEAEAIFRKMDKPHTNYQPRLQYCYFLAQTRNADALQQKIQELLDEFETMKNNERKMYRQIISDVNSLRNTQVQL